MVVEIIDRGRGPEIAGTRITVYHVMDYLQAGAPPDETARELGLTDEQVREATRYIQAHREGLEPAYSEILARVNRGNPDWVEERLASSVEELKARLAETARTGVNGSPPVR